MSIVKILGFIFFYLSYDKIIKKIIVYRNLFNFTFGWIEPRRIYGQTCTFDGDCESTLICSIKDNYCRCPDSITANKCDCPISMYYKDATSRCGKLI